MPKKEDKKPLIDEGLADTIDHLNKKDRKAQLESEAEELFEKQTQLLVLEKQLEQNEQFKNYLQLQKAVKTQDALFRESVKNEMIKYEIPKIQGEWGSITLVNREDYKVTDEDKIPTEYKEEKTVVVVDTKAIKEDYTLTGVLPAGVEIKKSQYIRITEKGSKK